MTQELMHPNQPAPFPLRNAMSSAVNAGAVNIEQERAVAEARGQIQVAQMFPRKLVEARDELMAECDCIEFAQVAFYNVPRAGGSVSGPSIRLAEAAAVAYGHMIWGHRELSRSDDKSEVEVFAWDMQKNNKRVRQVTVNHYRDTKNGPVKLRDEKDIQDKIANVASKQMRGCILAIVPKSFTEAAIARCKLTLSGGGGVPMRERLARMVDAFSKLGVGVDLLAKRLGHSLDTTNGDELADMIGIYNAIKAGDKIADHFTTEPDVAESDAAKESLAATAKASAEKQKVTRKAAEPKAEAKPEQAAEAKPEPVKVEESTPEPVKADEPEQQAESDAEEQTEGDFF
jgi:hypothetical protein